MSLKICPNEYNFLSDATAQILQGNYYEALASLQNCQEYIETSHKNVAMFVSLTVMHNTALCFYRLQTAEQALDYLEKTVKVCKNLLKKADKSTEALKVFKYVALTHLRICAIFSQIKNHEKALKHAQRALRFMKELIINTVIVISHFNLALKKKNDDVGFENLNKISLVLDKIISKKFNRRIKLFMTEGWINNYNIGNIMMMQPVLLSEWTAPFVLRQEINVSKTLENICILACCYFSIAAELRFLSMASSAERNLKSKDWHERALDICKNFLPNTCPLYQHIKKSYEKHYEPISKSSSPLIPSRFHSKRESEKGRTSSVKFISKNTKNLKKAQVSKKPTPIKKKLLTNTQKISIKGVKKKGKGSSGNIFTAHPIMSTQKVVCDSSGSEKCNS